MRWSQVVTKLAEDILTVENIRYVYERVEKVARDGLNTLPDLMKKKKLQYEKLQQEIQNYLNFVRMGNFSKAVSDALSSAEKKNDELTHEIGSLEFQDKNSFKAPPKEWIDHRLASLRETLNKDTVSSALALKELLGEIQLESVMEKGLTANDIIGDLDGIKRDKKGEIREEKGDSPNQGENDALGQSPFKPYYIAHTKIQTLALLDEEHKGSNWYHWRRVKDSVIRPPEAAS